MPVSYVSSNIAVASINGSIVTIEGAGTCTITAKQAGDATYSAAPDVPQTLTVNKANQTINVGQAGLPRSWPFDPQSTSTSGLPVTYAVPTTSALIVGTTIIPKISGLITLTISQPGDNNFNAAPNVTVDFNVNGGSSPYTFIQQDGDAVSQ